MAGPVDNFASQAEACDRLGSPFTARLCRAIPEAMGDTALANRIRNWPETATADALALRVCGALHALVLMGSSSVLAEVYPPRLVDEGALVAAVSAAIKEHDAFLTDYLDSPPQTNEVARSSMILGGALTVAQQTGLPLSVFELGASAGLNLWFSQYAYDLGGGRHWGDGAAPLTVTSEWRGDAPDLSTRLDVVARHGCDRNPLDPASPDHRLRLLSYVWPDQDVRLDRMRNALDHAGQHQPLVEFEDAADWVERHLQTPPEPGVARMLYHTIVWQYLPEPIKIRIEAAIRTAGEAATPETPLAWFRVEPDQQGSAGKGALMELTTYPDGQTRALGRADFHGRWVDWV